MHITTDSISAVNNKIEYFLIKGKSCLTASTAEEIRKSVEKCINSDHSVIYLDTQHIEEVDLSGINEVIHSNYMLQQASKKMILVYRKGSKIGKWVETTGLEKFMDTAIII